MSDAGDGIDDVADDVDDGRLGYKAKRTGRNVVETIGYTDREIPLRRPRDRIDWKAELSWSLFCSCDLPESESERWTRLYHPRPQQFLSLNKSLMS